MIIEEAAQSFNGGGAAPRAMASNGDGVRIVLTAAPTGVIGQAGYFIQVIMASLPVWIEGILNRKYPRWREIEYNCSEVTLPYFCDFDGRAQRKVQHAFAWEACGVTMGGKHRACSGACACGSADGGALASPCYGSDRRAHPAADSDLYGILLLGGVRIMSNGAGRNVDRPAAG